MVDDHLAAYHLPPAAPPAQGAPPAQPPARPAPARHLRLAPPPGGGGHRHTHAVSGEKVAALGPDGDVLGVEVSDAGEVHQSVVTWHRDKLSSLASQAERKYLQKYQ